MPHIPASDSPSTPDSNAVPDEPGAGSRVLVVDDSPKIVAMMERILGAIGIQVTACRTGEEALQRIARGSYALALLDVNLPGLSGFETARLIRSREDQRHLPIIFITGHSRDNQDIRRGYGLGAVDYLFKPIIAEVLCAKVKVFVDLHHRTAEVARQAAMLRAAERVNARRQLREERRRWEMEELQRQIQRERLANEQLSEADRHKDEFIAVLGHELRNPLATLAIGLEALADRCPASARVVETLETMERQVLHLRRLVDDLSDIARIRQGRLEMEPAPVDLGEVVESAVEICRSAIDRRRQRLTVEGPDDAVPLHADPVRLTQVVSNLLNNASRYSAPEGRIWLRWGLDEGHAHVRVTDQGQGIEPRNLEQVFDPFFQERDEGSGLGLGLALVHQIVEQHGGSVRAFSEGRGRGSEFVVILPARSADGRGHVELVPRASSTRRASLRVVLVDDNVDIRDLLADLIRSWGHEVIGTAGRGTEAVRILVRDRPDVAVVDIGLPDINGYEVARRVRAELDADRPRLIAVSGYREGQDQALFDSGFDALLVKPPEPGTLREALENLARPTPLSTRAAAH